MGVLHVLSGGAARGLIARLREDFHQQTGRTIEARFGAVGVMRDRLLSGEACDVLILTQSLIEELVVANRVLPESARAIGLVRTGVAVRAGNPVPCVETPERFKAALQSARAIYFADPLKTRAGTHLMQVIQRLGLTHELMSRLRFFGNGTAALQALCEADEAEARDVLVCTHMTEILATPGVQCAGLLPKSFELTTVYTAAITTRCEQALAARVLIDLLAASETAASRRAEGFE
jgi:molybdate transport system substrate-binding protein